MIVKKSEWCMYPVSHLEILEISYHLRSWAMSHRAHTWYSFIVADVEFHMGRRTWWVTVVMVAVMNPEMSIAPKKVSGEMKVNMNA